jgi:hypothetical protein
LAAGYAGTAAAAKEKNSSCSSTKTLKKNQGRWAIHAVSDRGWMPIRDHGLGVVVCWKAPTVALPEGRKEEKEEEAQAAAIAAGLQKPGPRAPPACNGTAKHIRVITWWEGLDSGSPVRKVPTRDWRRARCQWPCCWCSWRPFYLRNYDSSLFSWPTSQDCSTLLGLCFD